MIDVYRERDFHLDHERVIVHWLHRPFSRWSTFRIDIESNSSNTEVAFGEIKINIYRGTKQI